MKIAKITNNDPIIRVPLGLRQSVVDQLQTYREMYRGEYGETVPQNQLVEEMLRQFLTSDKDFQRYLKEREEESARGAVPTRSAQSTPSQAPGRPFAGHASTPAEHRPEAD